MKDTINFEDTLPVPNRSFIYNEQRAGLTCICGEELEVYSSMATTCTCGRRYELVTRVSVSWSNNLGVQQKYSTSQPEPPEAEDLSVINFMESTEE